MDYLTSKKKSLKNWIIGLIIILISLLVYGIYFIKSSMPPMDGQLNLIGLTEEVRVIRDQYGIPHIKAKNSKDALRSLGFVMASERLFQMELQRRMANGELAELFGPKFLASDKLFRTLGLRQSMSEMLEGKKQKNLFDIQMWQDLEAFYDGINQFQLTQKLPLEFSLLGIKPRPFTALDGYAFIGLMSFSFGIATSEDPLMSHLRERFGPQLIDELRNELSPKELQDKLLDQQDQLKKNDLIKSKSIKRFVDSARRYPVMSIMADLEKGFTLLDGSNGWLLAGSRTVSGSPILANDPHISFSHPGVWFEAHIETPKLSNYGHYLALLPFPILAHNLNFGWGLTMSLVDDMDLYREKFNPKFKTYQFKGSQIPYQERYELIKIKGEKPFGLLTLKTQHGPIMDEVFNHRDDKSLAFKWSFYGAENDPLLSLYKMEHAKNMTEFKAAVATGKAPGLNILYADKTNIGWWMFGEIAKKAKGTPSDFILDGSSGLDEYSGELTFDEKPHSENPSSGIIISANSRPQSKPSLPIEMRGDWQSDDRFKTLESILSKKEKWSPEELMEVQTLSMNFENKLILEELLKTVSFENIWNKGRAKQYLKILKEWDFVSSISSIAPSIYYTWCREISKILLKEFTLEEFETFSKLPNNWNFLKKVVLNPESIWWKKFNRQQVFTKAFDNTIESLRQALGEDSTQWAWGHLHTLEFVHPIGKIKPFNKIFNIGPIEMNGASNEINNFKTAGYTDGFLIKAGPSTRRIVSFDHPEKAWGILPTGISGHLFSPFYKDQLKLFAAGNYREEWLEEKEIMAHRTHQLNLLPAK